MPNNAEPFTLTFVMLHRGHSSQAYGHNSKLASSQVTCQGLR